MYTGSFLVEETSPYDEVCVTNSSRNEHHAKLNHENLSKFPGYSGCCVLLKSRTVFLKFSLIILMLTRSYGTIDDNEKYANNEKYFYCTENLW